MARKKSNSTNAPLYPVFLNLTNVPVLIVGGGIVAVRKLESLLSAGAHVTMVSPELHPSTKKHRSRMTIARREYRASDLKGKKLVFAATNHPDVNMLIARQAKRRGIFVNVIAPPEAGDVQIPGSIKHGSFCIAISTGGASPTLARAWRMKLEKMIGPEWGEWVALLEQKRQHILSNIRDETRRVRLLQRLGDLSWAKRVKRKGIAHVRREVDKLINQFK